MMINQMITDLHVFEAVNIDYHAYYILMTENSICSEPKTELRTKLFWPFLHFHKR